MRQVRRAAEAGTVGKLSAPSLDGVRASLMTSSVVGKHRMSPVVAYGRAAWPEAVVATMPRASGARAWLLAGSSLALLVSLGNGQAFEMSKLNWWAVLGLNQ
jgi:hypothetical protein